MDAVQGICPPRSTQGLARLGGSPAVFHETHATRSSGELQSELDAAHAMLETSSLILESVGEGILGLDGNGLTTFANPAAVAMTGWQVQDLIGNVQHELLHHSHADGRPYPREKCPIYMALRDGRVHRSDSEVFWRKDGTSFPVAYTSTPILRDGKPVGAVVLFLNISKRKRREEWEKSRNQIFAAITSHAKLETTLALIGEAFAALHPGKPIAILLREATRLNLVANVGLPSAVQDLFAAGQGLAADWHETSVCARAAEKGETIRARREEVHAGALPYRELAESGYRSCLAVPLLSGSQQVLGTVAVFSNQDGGPDDEETKAVDRACELARLAIEHSQLHAQLLRQSQHDYLTSLPNRLLLEDRLEQALRQSRRQGTMVAVCYLDLDRFKQVNDTLGHSVGDAFLQHVAGVLKRNLREIDTVARQGGDEFIVVLPSLSSEKEAEETCERVLADLRKPVTIGRHTLTPTASLGFSMYPECGASGPMLLRNADFALYAAKQAGRDRVQRYQRSLGEKLSKEMELQKELRGALERKEFFVAYQALYSSGRQLRGFEALLRWQHPQLGLVSPELFVPLAEENGLILPIGEWVLTEACREAVDWNRGRAKPLQMFVNISKKQLARQEFPRTVARILEHSGLAPHLLELEVTEGCVLADPEVAAMRLRELRDLGVGISIDDFGTGHSSFSCLQQLPVNTLKIDRSFIARLDGTETGSAIIQAIVALARQLGLQTVAEGVETDLQMEELREIHSGLVQGYLLAKPLAPDAVRRLLDEGK